MTLYVFNHYPVTYTVTSIQIIYLFSLTHSVNRLIRAFQSYDQDPHSADCFHKFFYNFAWENLVFDQDILPEVITFTNARED